MKDEPAPVRASGAPQDWIEQQQQRLRQEWWTGHGCPISALYGDDGEMQCNAATCRRDFKREPLEDLREHVGTRRLMLAVARHAAAAVPVAVRTGAEMSQPAPVHCWCRILRDAGGPADAKCGPCLARENASLKARLAAQEHVCVFCHHRWTGDGITEHCGDCHRRVLAERCDKHTDPLVCLACEAEESARPEWRAVSSPSVADSPTWQPIETAPRDQRVLALLKPHPFQSEGEIRFGYLTNAGIWTDDETGEGIEVTHWLPLPSAPSASATDRPTSAPDAIR